MKSKQFSNRMKAKASTDGSAIKPVVGVLISILVLAILVLISSSARGEIVSTGGVSIPTNNSQYGSQYGSIGSGGVSAFGYSSTGGNTASPSTNMVLNFQQTNGSQTNSPLLVAQANPTPVPVPAYNTGTYQPTPATSTWPGSTTSNIPSTSTLLGGNSPTAVPSTGTGFQSSLRNLDPYATPNQSSLFASNSVPGTIPVNNTVQPGYTNPYNSSQPNVYSGDWNKFFPETYQAMRRFREATSIEYTMIPKGSQRDEKHFGLSEIDLRMQLSIPCRFIPNNAAGNGGYFYIAPGGNIVWWDGPVGPPDMSPNGFGAFVDFGIQPQFNEVFGLDAWFRFGVYSDFKKVKSDAIRYQGRLVGLFNITPHVKIVVGAIYLDRVHHKILPTGGIVWMPKDDLILRLTFPNPKISKRLWNSGCAEWWGYVTADYGGDSWYISDIGQTDYNDIRVGVGLEFETYSKVSGHFEIGGSFDRELYSKNTKWASLSNAFYLKLGFVF